MLNSLIPFSREEEPLLDLHREFHKVLNALKDHREMRGFGENFNAAVHPNIDICETDKEINITAELPGVQEKDVNIYLQDNTLTITGEKKSEKREENKTYYRSERSYGKFIRTFPLPYHIKANAVNATFEQGLLKISIPKPTGAEAKASIVKIKNKNK